MPEPKTVDILLKFGLDAGKAREAAKLIGEVQTKAGAANTNLKGGKTAANEFSSALGGVAKQAAAFLTIGKVMSEMGQAVQAYVQQAGGSEKASRQWLLATQSLENSQVKIGRQLTEDILPAYQAIAKVVDKIASTPLLPKNSKGETDYGKMGAEAILTILGINNPGTMSLFNGIRANLEPKGTYGVGGRIGGPDTVAGDLTPGSGTAAFPNSGGGEGMLLPELQAMRQFQQATMEVEKAANRQKLVMQRDFNKQEEYANVDFQKGRMRSIRDFNKQLAYTDADYQRQRLLSARDFNIQLVRGEQDYQRQRARAEQDHNFDLFQIALSGDAMQYWLSQRQFNIEKTRSQEDHSIELQRSKEDFNRSRQDEETQFNISRSRTLEQHAIQLQDQDYDFAVARERALFSYHQSETDLAYSLGEQARLREKSFQDAAFDMQTDEAKLRALRNSLTQQQIDDYYNMMVNGRNLVQNIINSIGYTDPHSFGIGNNLDPTRGYADGGYTTPGRAMVHAGEFVLTKETTQAAESVARGNRLTQEGLVGMLQGGATYNDHRKFDSRVSAEDRKAINADTLKIVLGLLGAK